MNEIANEVMEVANSIRPLLAGRKPEVQSAALAELTATFLCGIQVLGDMDGTIVAQMMAFNSYVNLVMELVASGTCYPKGGQN